MADNPVQFRIAKRLLNRSSVAGSQWQRRGGR